MPVTIGPIDITLCQVYVLPRNCPPQLALEGRAPVARSHRQPHSSPRAAKDDFNLEDGRDSAASPRSPPQEVSPYTLPVTTGRSADCTA